MIFPDFNEVCAWYPSHFYDYFQYIKMTHYLKMWFMKQIGDKKELVFGDVR